jgi:2-polyprenyl-3-methyl-5-hydroxy-6-metoxy-1,4-benzoquinol methylase
VGSELVKGFRVLRCAGCDFRFLDPFPSNIERFYETEEYRLRFDDDVSPFHIQRKYDQEQNERVRRIGLQALRGKTIVDLGAAAGIFLDAVSGVAQITVAVEPTQAFHDHLRRQGHQVYSYAQEALAAGVSADFVVSFDVIEHLPRPREFVADAAKLLHSGGNFVLSMPNFGDLIRQLLPASFEPFFFQYAHLGYFSRKTVDALFTGAGFGDVSVGYLHKYGIGNLIQWCKNGAPGAFDASIFDWHFDEIYRRDVERLGISSHFFIKAVKQ